MKTIDTVRKLERTIAETEQLLERQRAQLRGIQGSCQHSWGPIKNDPVYKEGYTIPGDPPGTMGIDWRGPQYVPSETIPRWTRTCKKCGLTQETRRTKDEVTKVPQF